MPLALVSWPFIDIFVSFPGLMTQQCYLPGGYISIFDYNRTVSTSTLEDLKLFGWMNEATRVVFVEFIMYNVHTDLMSYVTPMLEHLADGSFQFHVKVSFALDTHFKQHLKLKHFKAGK